MVKADFQLQGACIARIPKPHNFAQTCVCTAGGLVLHFSQFGQHFINCSGQAVLVNANFQLHGVCIARIPKQRNFAQACVDSIRGLVLNSSQFAQNFIKRSSLGKIPFPCVNLHSRGQFSAQRCSCCTNPQAAKFCAQVCW